MKKDKRLKIKETIVMHILNNKKEYLIVTLLFIIGIFLGVFFTNHTNETQVEEVKGYLDNFMQTIKESQDLNWIELLKSSIWNYLILAITIWFFGTTVIGIPIVFGVILYKGFCLGYTISISISVMGIQKGLLFIFSTIFLQNLLIIPAMIALAVSGFKLYKSIVKDKRKDTIKIEILRHTVFSLVMLLLLGIAAVIEIFISTNILKSISGFI